MKRYLPFLLCAVLLIGCFASCSGKTAQEETTEAAAEAEPAEPSTLESYSFTADRPLDLSDLNAWDLSGETVDAGFFKDHKVTAVCVWASSAQPCVYNLIYMQNALDDYGEKGLGMLGIVADTATPNDPDVSLNDASGRAASTLSSVGADFTNIASTMTLNEKLKVDYIPMMFFVGPDGIQTGNTFIGAVRYDEFSGEIEKLLGEQTSGVS